MYYHFLILFRVIKFKQLLNGGINVSNDLDVKGVKSILFVCMGNICRSPSAEAVFRQKAREQGISLQIDSAGTLSAHAKEKPDHRSQKAGIARGYSFDGIKSRKVTLKDFESFDLVLAMDNDNIDELNKVAPKEFHCKIHLFLDFANELAEQQVPDPYYGGAKGFDYVLDLIEAASEGLLLKLK